MLEQLGHVQDGPGLVAQVELLAELQPEPVEHLEQLAGDVLAGRAGHDLEQRLEQVHVDRDAPLDAGPQHLHRDLACRRAAWPGGPPRSTPARSASRSKRAYASSSGMPSSASTTRRTWSNGTGRPGVEAGPELGRHLLAEHAGRRRDELAELHERRAELLERQPQRAGERIARAGSEGRRLGRPARASGREVLGRDPADLRCPPGDVGTLGRGQVAGEHPQPRDRVPTRHPGVAHLDVIPTFEPHRQSLSRTVR